MKNCYIKSINLFKALSENAKFSFISNLIHYYNRGCRAIVPTLDY